MKSLLIIFTIFTVVGCTISKPTKQETQFHQVTIDKPVIQNLKQVDDNLKKFKHSLVRLKVESPDGVSFGTAFFYKSKDLLVTNYHIFKHSRQCVIITHCQMTLGLVKDDKSVSEIVMNVRIEHQDAKKDLALIRILDSEKLSNIQPIKNKNTGDLEQLTVVGFFEENPQITFSKGKVVKDHLKENPLTLTSIIIGAGFSGSPVLNSKGELVGVVSSYRPIRGKKQVGLAQFINIEKDQLF